MCAVIWVFCDSDGRVAYSQYSKLRIVRSSNWRLSFFRTRAQFKYRRLDYLGVETASIPWGRRYEHASTQVLFFRRSSVFDWPLHRLACHTHIIPFNTTRLTIENTQGYSGVLRVSIKQKILNVYFIVRHSRRWRTKCEATRNDRAFDCSWLF